LYQQKGLNFAQVWTAFLDRLRSASIVHSAASFFSVSSISGSCPDWHLSATDYWHEITIDFQCSSSFTNALSIVGSIVLIYAAWLAFSIAFL
jgi:hypothetical protein